MMTLLLILIWVIIIVFLVFLNHRIDKEINTRLVCIYCSNLGDCVYLKNHKVCFKIN